ncbi:MAG: hypothetical protein WCB12_06825 [Bryobacteraceae bacterium]
MPRMETTYKWAAILFLFSAAMWIAREVTVEHAVLAIAHFVVGVTYLRLWRRQRLLRHRERPESSLLLGPSLLLTPGSVLAVAVLAAVNSVAWPLIKGWFDGR